VKPPTAGDPFYGRRQASSATEPETRYRHRRAIASGGPGRRREQPAEETCHQANRQKEVGPAGDPAADGRIAPTPDTVNRAVELRLICQSKMSDGCKETRLHTHQKVTECGIDNRRPVTEDRRLSVTGSHPSLIQEQIMNDPWRLDGKTPDQIRKNLS